MAKARRVNVINKLYFKFKPYQKVARHDKTKRSSSDNTILGAFCNFTFLYIVVWLPVQIFTSLVNKLKELRIEFNSNTSWRDETMVSIDIECHQNTDTDNKSDDDSMMDVSKCYEDIYDDMEITDLRYSESTDVDSESEFYVTVDSLEDF